MVDVVVQQEKAGAPLRLHCRAAGKEDEERVQSDAATRVAGGGGCHRVSPAGNHAGPPPEPPCWARLLQREARASTAAAAGPGRAAEAASTLGCQYQPRPATREPPPGGPGAVRHSRCLRCGSCRLIRAPGTKRLAFSAPESGQGRLSTTPSGWAVVATAASTDSDTGRRAGSGSRPDGAASQGRGWQQPPEVPGKAGWNLFEGQMGAFKQQQALLRLPSDFCKGPEWATSGWRRLVHQRLRSADGEEHGGLCQDRFASTRSNGPGSRPLFSFSGLPLKILHQLLHHDVFMVI